MPHPLNAVGGRTATGLNGSRVKPALRAPEKPSQAAELAFGPATAPSPWESSAVEAAHLTFLPSCVCPALEGPSLWAEDRSLSMAQSALLGWLPRWLVGANWEWWGCLAMLFPSLKALLRKGISQCP